MLIYVCINPLFFHVAHLRVHIVYIAHITRSNYWDRTVKLEHIVRWHMFHTLTCVRTVHVHDVRARKVSAYYCSLLPKTIFTHLVLGSRSVGLTSATFFSQRSQNSLYWHILNTVQGRQCHIVFLKIVQNCSKWPKLARQKCSKLLEMTRAGPKKMHKMVQNCSKLLKIVQNCQNCSKCFKNGPTSV